MILGGTIKYRIMNFVKIIAKAIFVVFLVLGYIKTISKNQNETIDCFQNVSWRLKYYFKLPNDKVDKEYFRNEKIIYDPIRHSGNRRLDYIFYLSDSISFISKNYKLAPYNPYKIIMLDKKDYVVNINKWKIETGEVHRIIIEGVEMTFSYKNHYKDEKSSMLKFREDTLYYDYKQEFEIMHCDSNMFMILNSDNNVSVFFNENTTSVIEKEEEDYFVIPYIEAYLSIDTIR